MRRRDAGLFAHAEQAFTRQVRNGPGWPAGRDDRLGSPRSAPPPRPQISGPHSHVVFRYGFRPYAPDVGDSAPENPIGGERRAGMQRVRSADRRFLVFAACLEMKVTLSGWAHRGGPPQAGRGVALLLKVVSRASCRSWRRSRRHAEVVTPNTSSACRSGSSRRAHCPRWSSHMGLADIARPSGRTPINFSKGWRLPRGRPRRSGGVTSPLSIHAPDLSAVLAL